MFKSATWRSEKKIKAVFKMKFQATQVPKLKAKTLTISLVPADVGKPTVRLEKSSIVEGTCSWENPVYETVKFIKETKTGKYKGKIYHFIVSTGSSKAGLLGEASVDFVDFLEAANPVILSLPLEPTNSGAILHVTIQKVEGTLEKRYMEEDESPTVDYYDGSLDAQLEDSDNLENKTLEFTQGEQFNRTSSHHPDRNISLSYTQSQDNRASQACATNKDKTPEKVFLDADVPGNMHRRYPDWSYKDTSDESLIDTTNSPREKYEENKTQESSNGVGSMSAQIKLLERQAEVSNLELQSLRRQVAKESRKVQELAGRIVALIQERDALKTEREHLKFSPKGIQEQEVSNDSLIATDNLSKSEEIKQELCHEKHLNKKLKFQLQKTEDSNSELIVAVRDLKEALNKKNKEICHLSAKPKANQADQKALADAYMCKMGQKEERKGLEETVRDQSKDDEADHLKQELANLSNEIEVSRKEKEELQMCIQQLTMDYKTVKQENENVYSDLQQKQIEIMEMQHEYSDSLTTVKQLKLQEDDFKQVVKNQSLLYSGSLATIDKLETKVKSLENKLKKEAKDFQDKLTEVSRAELELEQRAIRAEEALRNANWSKTKISERLRNELRKKCEEMTSKINENEKLAIQAVAEANELRLQNEALQKANDDIQLKKYEYEKSVQDLSKGINVEEQSVSLVSTEFGVKKSNVDSLKGNEDRSATAIDIKAFKNGLGNLQSEKRVCSQEVSQKGRQYVESEMEKKRSEDKELERKVFSLRKEAEILIQENISLRTLIEEKKKRDEILNSEMQKMRIQHNELKRCSEEMNLENRNLKKHVLQLKEDVHLKQQEKDVINTAEEQNHSQNAYRDPLQQNARPAKDKTIHDKAPERKGDNTHYEELGNLDASKAAIELCGVQSERNEPRSRRELKTGNPDANNVSHLAKLLDEIASLKEGNKHMAVELKEMQERYSEISLKFAEVEGERQQLVMKLRNLKNGKKT